ncbi:MAG TPA: AAA family ATPase [Solirubrobacterales bacterium]|jgi:DNA-binding CsgD family transcriptional regulator|nr:AAA family ATPase [Solirubrobacterales bacterium]
MELIERSGDLHAIEGALTEVPGADGCCLLLSGPAGIGKTALLDEACHNGRSRGFELLRATGFEFERGHPFGVVRQLYAGAVRELGEPERSELLGGAGAVFEARNEGTAADPSHQILLGLYWLLAELGQTSPLLVAVDDVQWADDPSLRHLLHLSRRLEGLPIALLLAERSGEASVPVLDELRASAFLRVEPAPLSSEGAGRLIESALGEPATAGFAAACLRQTGGYPLYLKETALALRERGIRPDDSAVSELEQVEAEGLEQHVWRRVEAVDPAAANVVRAICVLGEGARRGRIARLAEVPAARAVAIIDGLVAHGLLTESEIPRFTHPVVRSGVEARLASGQRDELHRAAARLLDGEGTGIEEVGNHLMRCVPEADPWVVERLREFAAEALRRGAPESAAAASSRALEEPPREGDCATTLRELAAAEDAAGRPDAALEHLAKAAKRESTNVSAQVDIAISRARILASVNRWPEAVSSLDHALALVAGTDTTLEQLIDAELITYSIISETVRGPGFERLASYGGKVPDGPAASAVLTAMAVAIGFTGERAPEAAALAERALQLDARQGPGPDRERWLIAATVLTFCDRPDIAHEAARKSLAQVRRNGHRREIFAVEITRAMASLQLGAIPEAVAAAQASLSVVDPGPHAAWGHGLYALALFESGELEAVARALAATDAEHWSGSAPGSASLFWARAQLGIAQGQFEQAATDLAELRRRGEATGPGIRSHTEVRWPVEVLLAHRLGESEKARELAATELEFSRRFEGPHYIGQMLRLSGIVNEPEDGLAFLREAVDVLAPSVFRLEYAKALVELGAALRRRGERAAAREPLREGLDLAYRCGAGPVVTQALEELRATGARPRRAVREGPDALTAAESRTALLAARGRSNREIAQELCVTLKTVEGTLMHAYSKLGISGRGAREALPEALGPLFSE